MNKINYLKKIYYLLLFDFLPIYLIAIGSVLISIQLRLQLSWGKDLGSDYSGQSIIIYILIMVSTILGAVFSTNLRRFLGVSASKTIRMFSLVLVIIFSSFLIMVVQPDISQLQITYYSIAGLIIGLITIIWPPYLTAYGEHVTIFYHLKKLWDYRVLISIWVKYNIYSRYSQTALGILWIMIFPLSSSLIIAFVFSQIFRFYDIGDAPFISFFLVAVTFWNLFNQGVTLGMHSLISKLGLITQVYFPREIVVISKVGETLVDLFFVFISMLIINAFLGVWPNARYIYLPIIIAIQLILTIGISFFLSYLSTIIRDIPNLMGIVLQLLFYLTPILYPSDVIPDKYNAITMFNPISPLIHSYREIILYNRTPDFVGLLFPAVSSCILFYTGYKFFKAKENILADFV